MSSAKCSPKKWWLKRKKSKSDLTICERNSSLSTTLRQIRASWKVVWTSMRSVFRKLISINCRNSLKRMRIFASQLPHMHLNQCKRSKTITLNSRKSGKMTFWSSTRRSRQSCMGHKTHWLLLTKWTSKNWSESQWPYKPQGSLLTVGSTRTHC